MPSRKRKKSSALSSSKHSSTLSTKRRKPQKKTTAKAKKKNRQKPVTFPYDRHPLVRYPAKDFTEQDMKAFMKDFPKELKSLADLVKHTDACRRYQTNKNPIDLLQSVILSHKLGVYPPPEVLAQLASGFQFFLEKKGDLSLDKCLKIPGGHGQRKYLKQQAREERDHFYIEIVYYLQKYFNISLEDAAPLASSVYFGPAGTLTPNSIQKHLTSNKEWKNYKDKSRLNGEDHPVPDWAQPDAPAITKKFFLIQFPHELLPTHIITSKEFKDLPEYKQKVTGKITWKPGQAVCQVLIPGCITSIPIRRKEADV